VNGIVRSPELFSVERVLEFPVIQRIHAFVLGDLPQSLSVHGQSPLSEKRGEERTVLGNVERGVEVSSSPDMLDGKIDIVKRVNVDPDQLGSGEHVLHKVEQRSKGPRELIQIGRSDGGMESLLDDIPVVHVEEIPSTSANLNVVRGGEIGEKGRPDFGQTSSEIVRSTGETLLEVRIGQFVRGVGETVLVILGDGQVQLGLSADKGFRVVNSRVDTFRGSPFLGRLDFVT
jgi:hypothetical protein